MPEKICNKCGEGKDDSCFSKHQSVCKICRAKVQYNKSKVTPYTQPPHKLTRDEIPYTQPPHKLTRDEIPYQECYSDDGSEYDSDDDNTLVNVMAREPKGGRSVFVTASLLTIVGVGCYVAIKMIQVYDSVRKSIEMYTHQEEPSLSDSIMIEEPRRHRGQKYLPPLK